MSTTSGRPEPVHARHALGLTGEDAAIAWLEEQGWEVLERNYSTKLGEVDVIVMRPFEELGRRCHEVAFVEVKTRRQTRHVAPEINVNKHKRKRIVRVAKLYLQRCPLPRVAARFDVVAVSAGEEGAEIAHFPHAFDADGRLI